MSKTFFIDTTLCTACRGCQVACKQWHDLPAEATENRGTYQNPPDLSFQTYKLVRMREEVIEGKLNWLFFPDQCRHCIEPPCRDTVGDPTAIFKDEATGAVLYTANTANYDPEEIRESCPYNIPRADENGYVAKCDMCIDRVQNGLLPACVATCPTGAMNFGDREEIMETANQRLQEVQKRFPSAQLLDADTVEVVYLVVHDPLLYNENAIASRGVQPEITRHAAIRRMISPFMRAVRIG